MFNKILVNITIVMLVFSLAVGLVTCVTGSQSYSYNFHTTTLFVKNYKENNLLKSVVIYPNLPIKVYRNPNLPLSVTLAVAKAIKVWNDTAGCEIYALSSSDMAEIRVRYEENPPKGKTWAATHTYVPRGFGTGGLIVVYKATKDMLDLHQTLVLVHELGHGLGLDHVNNELSIMYYSANNGKFISDHQLNFVRSLYCGKHGNK